MVAIPTRMHHAQLAAPGRGTTSAPWAKATLRGPRINAKVRLGRTQCGSS